MEEIARIIQLLMGKSKLEESHMKLLPVYPRENAMSQLIAVASLLMDIEHELRLMNLGESLEPSPEALASTEPFAIDTLTFSQWLQFIFIPKMYYLIDQKNLPSNCSIAPMAEEYFAHANFPASALVSHLKAIDKLLSK